jgi:hypothetical protein
VKRIIGLLLFFMASGAFGQRSELVNPGKIADGAPPFVRKILQHPVVGPDGFSFLISEPQMVRELSKGLLDVRAHVEGRDKSDGRGKYSADLSEMKLPFAPAGFDEGQLIGAFAPNPPANDDAGTVLLRYWKIADAGEAGLLEGDITGQTFTYFTHESLLNSKVNDNPASSIVVTGDYGASLELITWISGSRLYLLYYLPRMGAAGKAAPDVSAYSLAQRVR